MVGKGTVAGHHAIDVVGFVECRCPVGFQIVACMVNNREKFTFTSCKFHAAAVEGDFGAK